MSPSDQGMRDRQGGRQLADNPYPESAMEDSPFMRWRAGWMSLGTSFRLRARTTAKGRTAKGG
jgi:hypothetical protein